MKPLALIAALLLATAPALHAEDNHDHDHLTTLGAARLLHAWTPATAADAALVYVEIENTGAVPLDLTGGDSPRAASVELVGFQLRDGAGVWVPLDAVPVAGQSVLALAPERLALRLNGLTAPLAEGESFPLHIALGGSEAEVTVAVEPAGARQHSHAGHKH